MKIFINNGFIRNCGINMTKLFHYFICTLYIIKKYLKRCFIWFGNRFVVFFRFTKCLFLLKSSVGTISAEYELSHYYPDTGNLSDKKGYLHEETVFDLSIIIPVYNSEKYIEECLTSIISQQTNYTYEIILVDDGSTDNTVQKIASYLSNLNIKLIKQENSGQSVSRNRALCESLGKYIMFVDSDDLLLPNAIQNLMDAATINNADISEGDFVWFRDKITKEMIQNSTATPHIESYRLKRKFILTSVGYSWAKVYRRDLWENLRFPEGYIFEDVITKFILRRKANTVVFTGIPVYGYRYNNTSSSHGNNSLKKLDSVWVYPKIIELCKQENVPFDDIFYLLSLNHIGLLNYITSKNQSEQIQMAVFYEMKKQLESIKFCKARKMPIAFKLLEQSILNGKFEVWKCICDTITKYRLAKKWREIN